MFFIISKLLYFIVSPFIWICGLLVYSLLAKKPARKKKSFIAAIIMLLIFSNSFIFDEVMRLWEIKAIAKSTITEPYDYGIVLSGMISYDQKLKRINFHRGIDRLLQAVNLYRDSKIKKIFISGIYGSLIENHKEAELLRNFLIKLGIPEEDVLYETESNNTHQNAVNTIKAIYQQGNGRYLLITSAYHMRRAVKCFEKEGMKVDPYSANRFSGPRKFVFDHLFIPNGETLSGWNVMTHELVGYITYFIMGYI
ncbi:MAG: YdcF family protein [Bacteroidia bacterium]|nr:YdcF family protein [Bacteroidia bacterium]